MNYWKRKVKNLSFKVILSVLNHPPFAVPEGYKPLLVKPIPALKVREDFGVQSKTGVMHTYQCAINALGNFINRVEAQKKGTNDHFRY